MNPRDNLLLLRDGVPRVEELNEVVIDKFGHAKKGRKGSRKSLYGEDGTSSIGSSVTDGLTEGSKLDSNGLIHGLQQRKISISLTDSKLNEMKSPNDENLKYQGGRNLSLLKDDGEKMLGNLKQSLYRKKDDFTPQTSSESVKRRIPEEIKTRELKNIFNEGSEKAGTVLTDNSAGYEENQPSTSQAKGNDEVRANWLAQKPRGVKRGNNPEEWQEILHHRLTQELVEREIKQLINEKERDENHHEDEDDSIAERFDENWATQDKVSKKTSVDLRSDGILSRPITTPEAGVNGNGSLTIPSDTSANTTDSIDMKTFLQNHNEDIGEDFEEDRFSVSPSESVSSIDLRLHSEADEIYRLRYFSSNQSKNDLPLPEEEERGSVYPPPVYFEDSSGDTANTVTLSKQDLSMTRPLSPDSLISQDDFVKPPISTSNIDRDALLFHQMQMARAQAHAGSLASLDSVQSAPMHTSRRDIFPQARTSSHSIEVLVNIGEGEEDDRKKERSSSSQGLGRSLSGTIGYRYGSIDHSQSGSSSTITGSSVANLNSVKTPEFVDNESSHQSSRSSQERIKYSHFVNESKSMHAQLEDSFHKKAAINNKDEDDDDDDDRNTLVGDNDVDDIANLKDVEIEDADKDYLKDFMEKKNGPLQLQNYNEVSTVPSVELLDSSASSHPPEDDKYASNDSDSDESIGNVSLGDGYTAIEFPTNIDRNGSMSMLNILESESEDYPEIFAKMRAYEQGSNIALRRSLKSFKRQNEKIHHGRSNVIFGSQQKSTRPSQGPIENSKITKTDKTLSTSSTMGESDRDLSEHSNNGDYEDIDELKVKLSEIKAKQESLETFVGDMNLYEEMQYSPTDPGHHTTMPVESPTADQPTEEDIDALYAKVNKIKMQKIRGDSSSKANMDGLLLLEHTTISDSTNFEDEAKPPLPPRFTPEGMETLKNEEEEIFLSASDLLPKRTPPPPIPIKPANGFPKIKRRSPTESDKSKSQLHTQTSLEGYTQFGQRTAHKNQVHSLSQDSTTFNTPISTPVMASKLSNGVHDSVNAESKSKTFKSPGNKSPPQQSVMKEQEHQSGTKTLTEIRTSSSVRKPLSPHLNTAKADVPPRARSKSPSIFPPPKYEEQRNSNPPPPLPPKKPYFKTNIQPTTRQPSSRPHFPLKPQVETQHPQHSKQQEQYQQLHQHQQLQQPNSQENSNLLASLPHQDTVPFSTFHPQRTSAPPAPKPRLSKKSSNPPSIPQTSSNQMSSTNFAQPSRFLEPLPVINQPIRPERVHLPPGGTHIAFPHVEDNGDDEFDNSVLSAHELYPDSHFPGSSYLPSSAKYPVGTSHLPSNADMAAAASKLPTQRSVIITYL